MSFTEENNRDKTPRQKTKSGPATELATLQTAMSFKEKNNRENSENKKKQERAQERAGAAAAGTFQTAMSLTE